jgi:ABC-type nickel/cobalt efflux system permease component RcnA
VKSLKRSVALVIALLSIFVNSPAQAHPELVFYIDTSATVHNEKNALLIDYYIAKSDQIAFEELALAQGDLEQYARAECEQSKSKVILNVGTFPIELKVNGATAIERLESTGAGVWIHCTIGSDVEFYDEVEFEWQDLNFSAISGHREFNVGLGNSPSFNLADFSSVPEAEKVEKIASKKPTRVDPTPISEPTPIAVAESKDDEIRVESSQSWLTRTSDRYFRAIEPTPLIVFIGVLFSILLGALHSIAPGHGKSLMAVLTLAENGKRREIYKLGFTMGLTHTLGVLILGLIFIVSSNLVPTSIIPLLGVISGSLVVLIGAFYLIRHVRHASQHQHGIGHHHHEAVGTQRIVVLGIVGGMVPTPTALTVMVGTAALGSAWYGVLLVTSYGVGMTLVLIFAGRLIEAMYRKLELLSSENSRANKIVESAPLVAALVQVMAGLFLVVISYGALI